MIGIRLLACALFAVAVGACATRRAETLDAMIGQDVDVAIETLGQPAEVIDLGDGRRSYVWQRIFTYDYGPPSFTLEQWRYESTFWFEDEVQEAPARLCATRLAVGFDFRIESWDYGCETITVQREQWPASEDRGNPIDISR
jgi:hypothetical protein